MYTSLGAYPPRNRRCYEVLPGSTSSSETTSSDPMFSTSVGSSHSSTPATDSHHTFEHSDHLRSTSSSSHSAREASTSSSSSAHQHNTQDSPAPSDSRFDSLHELLERAGYKETRVVTPDRQSLAGMFAKKLATPPRRSRLVDDFSSDSPSLAADELRRAIQRNATSRSTPKAASTSKSLPSRNLKLAATADPSTMPPLPTAPAPSSSWFSGTWFFGPGAIFSESSTAAIPAAGTPPAASQTDPQQSKAQPSSSAREAPAASASTSASSVRPKPPTTKRTASHNPVWTASVAYRSSRSNTAPVRKSAGIASTSSDVMSSDAAAEEEWKALQKGGSNGGAKRRPGLVDAFSSPTKKVASKDSRELQSSPGRQRKWRQERAAWRESLGDLQAMMDQSRLRREAAAAAVAASAASDSMDELAELPTSEDASAPISALANSSEETKGKDQDAVAKLLSGPALPFLSTDPAVAPRNGSCTRPTHLSMRRMKSVEVLSKIMREPRTVSSATSAKHSETPDTPQTFDVDTEAGQISPTIKKRSTPPRLTVTSPSGISSPKELALEGQEYEPVSVDVGGQVVISNRKVQKKPRSKLRHVSSGSDLRSAAAADAEGLKMPSRRRGRSKSRSSPAKEPIEAILRDSVGTLFRGHKIPSLRHSIDVFQDDLSITAEDTSTIVDDSPTRMRSRARTPQRPLILSSGTHNTSKSVVEDIFAHGPTYHGMPRRNTASSPANEAAPVGPVLRKKDFSAKITKTSKIMRLIEEAENVPSIASMISGGADGAVETKRAVLGNRDVAPQPVVVVQHKVSDDHFQLEQKQRLSSSLSRKSRERMHTITRVLGQRQPC